MRGFRQAKWWMVATAACSAGAYFTGSALAQGIPLQEPLAYSGQLTDADGAPSNGTFDIDIVLWESATGDASDERLCETADRNVNVQSGYFRVVLDQDCLAAVSDNSNVWVEVRVDGESLGRTKIASVPYAVTANRAVSAAEGGELAQVLASLREELDAHGDRLETLDSLQEQVDEQQERLDGFDSGWISLPNGALTLDHELGSVPAAVTVQVEEGDAVQLAGFTLTNTPLGDRNARGIIVTDMTVTSLTIRPGLDPSCPLYDTLGHFGADVGDSARRCAGYSSRVRVRAWR